MMASVFRISILVFIVSACNHQFSLQKRKYTRGFYFSNSSKIHSHSTSNLSMLPKITIANHNVDEIEQNKIVNLNKLSNELNLSSAEASEVNHTIKLKSPKLIPKKLSFVPVLKLTKNYSKIISKKVANPEAKLFDKVLFIVLCFLTGVCFVFGLGALVLYLSSLNLFYLFVTIGLLAFAGLFYVIVNQMNE